MDFEAHFSPGGGHDTESTSKLGDSVQYSVAGGPAVPIKAFVNFGETKNDAGLSANVVQAYDIEIPISQLSTRPSKNDRFTVTRLAGKTFSPLGATITEDGLCWGCTMKTVVA